MSQMHGEELRQRNLNTTVVALFYRYPVNVTMPTQQLFASIALNLMPAY